MSEEKKKIVPKRLSREVYRALEDIVGSKWISEDRAIIESCSKFTIDVLPTIRLHKKDPRTMPACIIMPETTEEIQVIVKVCNRFKVPFVPLTNGQWNSFAPKPGTITIYLKRMNKILKIDEEKMTMTVQPFIDYAQANVEAMKRGLWNGGTPLATAICKLASQFSTEGFWQTDLKYGGINRNVVSVKLVLPTGEILTTGSRAIAGADDFWEYSPGPDLIGILRGGGGTYGIVTEITIKLHPWVGGTHLPEDAGRPCVVKYPEGSFDKPSLPERHRIYFIEFPNFESEIEALYKISQSGIGIALNTPELYNAQFCSRTQEEAEKRYVEEFFPKWFCYVVTAGISSKKQLEYEEKVLKQIIKETKGKLISKDYKPEVFEALAPWNLDFALATCGFRWNRRGSSPVLGVVTTGPIDLTWKVSKIWCDTLKKYGTVSVHDQSGCERTPMIYVLNRGHFAFSETELFPKHSSLKEIFAAINASAYSLMGKLAKGIGGGFFADAFEPLTSTQPEWGPNAFLLFRKFRKIFDPNNIAAPGRKVWTKEEYEKEKPGILDEARKIWGLPPKEEVH